MNCREAQSMIHAFVEDKLSDEDSSDFLDHIHTCSSCYDELEVYYTVTEAMRHFDDDAEDIPANLPKALREKIAKEESHLKKHRIGDYLKIIIVGLLTIALTVYICYLYFEF